MKKKRKKHRGNRARKFNMKHRMKWLQSGRVCPVVQVAKTGEGLAFSCAAIYRSEFEKVMRWIAASPDIETGGELFGFYRDNGTPVVCYAIGPGPKANHQYTFFNQDLDYLVKVGNKLTEEYGLEHIGEWHSHHRLGLAQPSGHDAATIADGIRKRGRRRFLLCVGNIREHQATLGGFAFTGDSGEHYERAAWEVVNVKSPYREAIGEI